MLLNVLGYVFKKLSKKPERGFYPWFTEVELLKKGHKRSWQRQHGVVDGTGWEHRVERRGNRIHIRKS